uniref:Uncharacterized protein n=1 Tax=Eutreptia viridis TaxID=96908 RepID=H8ZXD3_9EUGL|nr:hypothetical protein [Eutreptia viridis]
MSEVESLLKIFIKYYHKTFQKNYESFCKIRVLRGILYEAIFIEDRATTSETPSISYKILPGLITATQYSTLPLPDPIRVSAARKVIGLSGKTRIQSFPPRRA